MVRTLVLALALAACSKSDPPRHEDRHEPATAPTKLALAVAIGDAKEVWGDAAFAATPKLAGSARDGEARDTWSLRELVHRNVGPAARVTAVVSPGGRVLVEQTAWDDATRTPILHTTRRGTLKFRWADKAGTWGETVMKDVSALEIAR